MRYFLLLCLVLLPLSASLAEGRFIGKLEFMPSGCEAQGTCRLKYPFGFIDEKGTGWEALSGPNGLQTDGASIPEWAQDYIGPPFHKGYIRAAVIHDHYCWRHVRPWQDTHRVFYEALVVSGVPKPTALLMYYAVYWKGPRWVELISGTPCSTGRNCVRMMPFTLARKVPDTTVVTGEKGVRYLVRRADYDAPELAPELGAVARLIDQKKGDIGLKDLEARADAKNPGDFFRSRPSKVLLTLPDGVER